MTGDRESGDGGPGAPAGGPPEPHFILRAELFHKGRSVVAHTMELTETTAMVRTDELLNNGDRLLVRLSFPGLLEPFDLEAHVASRRLPAGPGEPAGVTLVFVFANDEEEEHLRLLLTQGLMPSEVTGSESSSFRVLLVEDSETIRDMLLFGAHKHIRGDSARFHIDFAESAEQAWEMLQTGEYHLAIVDYFLPGMHGAQLVERVRSEPALGALPVVAISIGGSAARDRFMAAGADVYLDKPVVVRDLLKTLDRLLTRLGHAPRRRVLLVDDSPLFLEIVKTALEDAGYSVLCADSLSEVERLTSARPDLVLMDVQMPEAFGDDVAMVMRGMRGVKVPIYLLSSLDTDELSRRAAEAEVDGFISKNAGIEHLIERVRDILARQPAVSR